MITACAAHMCNRGCVRACARVCARMILPLGFYDCMHVGAPLFSTMLVLANPEVFFPPPTHSSISSRCASELANTPGDIGENGSELRSPEAWLGVWRRPRQGDGGVAPRRADATTNSIGTAADGLPRERGGEEIARIATH